MNRDKGTYDAVGGKFEEFLEIQKEKPLLQRVQRPAVEQRPYSPPTDPGSSMGKNLAIAIGVGLGLLLLLLAGLSAYTASQWSGVHYNGAAVGYTVVTLFLLLSGIGGILATLNHNLRVVNRPGGHH